MYYLELTLGGVVEHVVSNPTHPELVELGAEWLAEMVSLDAELLEAEAVPGDLPGTVSVRVTGRPPEGGHETLAEFRQREQEERARFSKPA